MADPVIDGTVVPVVPVVPDPNTTPAIPAAVVDPPVVDPAAVVDPNGGITPDPSAGAAGDDPPAGPAAAPAPVIPPYDQDPKWKAARAAEKQLTDILADKGFASVEDLIEAVDRGSNLEEVLSGADITQVMEQASTLTEYERRWAEQERTKLLEGETPEQTIARLELEKTALTTKYEADKSKFTQATETETQVKQFNTDISTVILQQEVPEEYRKFAGLLLGADNPMLDVDMSNKQAFNQTALSMIGKITAFEQAVVARYIAGKIKPADPAVPITPAPDGGGDVVTNAQKPIKNLADAKKAFLEKLTALRKQ